MLTRDLSIEDFDTKDWTRMLGLFGLGGEPHTAVPSVPAALFVTRDGRLLKAFHTVHGRLSPEALPWPAPLSDLALEVGARWASRLELGALDDVMERFSARLRREHDLIAQFVSLVRALREVEAEGRIEIWPRPARAWPVGGEHVIEGLLDVVCPEGRVVLVGAFSRGEVATCIALHRRGSGFDRIVGPERVRREMGLVSGDWTRDYRFLSRAVELAVGPLALGCFAEEETFHRLARDATPGAWTAAVASQDVVLQPVVAAVAVPLGIDIGRVAYATVRDVASRLGVPNWFGPESPLLPLLGRMREAGARNSVGNVLGFNPIALFRELVEQSDRQDPKS